MGQYYLPIFLDDKLDTDEKILAFMSPHKYENGLKLMEHSWLKNDFVNTVERLLSPRGKYSKKRLVWAGDYADDEPTLNSYSPEGNLYDFCIESLEIKPKAINTPMRYRYLLNHTKKQFVDKIKAPIDNIWVDRDGKTYEYKIHPLPLLTCEGNGRGGGDYRSDNTEYVGIWARDSISVGNRIPEGYTEIVPNFKESNFNC